MSTYLDRYLVGEREAVWAELTALGAAIQHEPLAADAQAVARETMRRARANVELLVERLTSVGYRFLADPYVPPRDESLAALRELEARYGLLPLSLRTWYEVVGEVDFMGAYPRLSSYEEVDLRNMGMWLQGQRLRVSLVPELRVLGPLPDPDPDPDVGICSDPLVVWPCNEGLVDELDEEPEQPGGEPRIVHSLCLAPDALMKANVSGGDGPHLDFAAARMDAALRSDDWDGVPFITYLRTAFAWGGFPGLRYAKNAPRDLLTPLCEGLLPL